MSSDAHHAYDLERRALEVLRPLEAAEELRLSKRTLERMRVNGDGPKYVRLGSRRIGYRIADLRDWLASRTYSSTSHEFS